MGATTLAAAMVGFVNIVGQLLSIWPSLQMLWLELELKIGKTLVDPWVSVEETRDFSPWVILTMLNFTQGYQMGIIAILFTIVPKLFMFPEERPFSTKLRQMTLLLLFVSDARIYFE